jgi:hypothetical protein
MFLVRGDIAGYERGEDYVKVEFEGTKRVKVDGAQSGARVAGRIAEGGY